MHVYLWLFQIFTLLLTLNCNNHAVHAAKNNKATSSPTQTSLRKYLPPKLERRVWTNTYTDPITLETRLPTKEMEFTLRDFATNCDGYCLYHLGNATVRNEAHCVPKSMNCHLVVSIAQHSPEQFCPHMTQASGKYLNNSLCRENDIIYSVSLFRSVVNLSCKSFWDYEKLLPCYPTEYVAVQFIDDVEDHEKKDREEAWWYVCVAGETTVLYWEDDNYHFYTEPIWGTAPGVVATTKISLNREEKTFSCQFLISRLALERSGLGEVKFNSRVHNKIYVKVAQGRVLRTNETVPQELKVSHNGISDKQLTDKEISEYLEKQSRPQYPKPKYLKDPDTYSVGGPQEVDPEDEFIITDQFIGPNFAEPDDGFVDLNLLEPETESLFSTVPESEHKKAEAIIYKAIEECKEQKKNVACFTPGESRNCVDRKKCVLMAIVTPVRGSKLTKFHFRLIHFAPHTMYDKLVIRPHGYMSLGFSRDGKMGNDIVVTCKFVGDSRGIDVSYNMPDVRNNLVNLTVNQDIIFDPDEMVVAKYEDADRVMCGWKMNAKFEIETSVYDREDKMQEYEIHHKKQGKVTIDTFNQYYAELHKDLTGGGDNDKDGDDGDDRDNANGRKGGDDANGGDTDDDKEGDGDDDKCEGKTGKGKCREPAELKTTTQQPEHFEMFDLMQPSCKGKNYVLLAAGTYIYPNSSIAYHTFREFIRNPVLNKETFSKAAITAASSMILPAALIIGFAATCGSL